jgi:hypothetical protein
MVNSDLVLQDYETSHSGEPVHVHLPESAVGPGSEVHSAASLAAGTTGSGIYLTPLTLKCYAALGAIAGTSDQIWLRSSTRFDTPFEIVSAGEQRIYVNWSGHLHYSGDSYAQYSLRIGFNPWNGVYDLLVESDFVGPGNPIGTDAIINESRILTIDIPTGEIGKTYYLQVYLWTVASMEYGGGWTDGAYADFYDSFTVSGWSEGLRSMDGITPIPIPGAFWLLTSGLIGLVGIRRRHKTN